MSVALLWNRSLPDREGHTKPLLLYKSMVIANNDAVQWTVDLLLPPKNENMLQL